MSLSFCVNDNVGIIAVVGVVDFPEGMEILKKEFDKVRNTGSPPVLLFDLSRSTANRSRDELQLLATFIHEQLPGASLAVVVNNDLHFGIGRMFAAYAESYELETQVFREMDEALAWCKARTQKTN